MKDVSALTPPSVELAERILREVSWAEKLEAYICDTGSGEAAEHVLQVRHLHNLMRGMSESFVVDPEKLRAWVGDVLGDEEMAAEIGRLLDEVSGGDENAIWDKVWAESDEEAQAEARILAQEETVTLANARTGARDGIVRLLGERIAQCEAVIDSSEVSSSAG